MENRPRASLQNVSTVAAIKERLFLILAGLALGERARVRDAQQIYSAKTLILKERYVLGANEEDLGA